MRLRTDCGTENGTMAASQCTLRHHHNDYYSGVSSHMYVSSTINQRIESWWSIFRKGRFGSRDCRFKTEQAELDAFPEAHLSIALGGDPNMQECLDFAMEHNQLQKPENLESPSEHYMKQRNCSAMN